jgi:hypothetical protein
MQVKLHRWAVADPGRRFDDLFNFVCDPATLIGAFTRVADNRGARTPGVDGLTVADVEQHIGVPGFLDDLRARLKAGTFRPLPVRERKIPKPGGSGRFRKLGIPTVADRVVQAALKLVLEPIFEADFQPVSYGFWYHLAGHHPSVVRDRRDRAPWYVAKRHPSYLDMIVKLRRVLIAAQYQPEVRAFVFRNADNQSRLYTVETTGTGLAAAATLTPAFQQKVVPAPPR